MKSAIRPDLIAAYEATHYAVTDGAIELVLRIGRHDMAVDKLLDRHGARSATIITACNPQSIVLPAAENARREAELLAELRRRRLNFLPAEGRDPAGSWSAETSCCVLDVAPAEAAAIGRQFGQNAIVSVVKGDVPRLLLLR